MSKRFAVKLGEIHLISNEPITPELAKIARENMARELALAPIIDGLFVEFRLPPSP